MPEGLDKLTGAIGDTLKTAPTLYEDALQPTVQEVGKFVSRVPRAINAAFSGLDKWILNKEYAINETKKLLAKKLEHVGEDKIVTPEPYVAVPAIQAISYSMNSKELRNLYANLLAKAMNSDTKDLVHPSFVEIIKQMSPTDSIIFKEIGSVPSFTVAKITAIEYEPIENLRHYRNLNDPLPPSSKSFSFDRITNIDLDYEIVLTSIDNLLRIRLINEEQLYYDVIPSDLRGSKVFELIRSKIKEQMTTENWSYEEITHDITLTNLGHNFFNICVSNV